MKKHSGFTLIELVMVIVILGILAAFAFPRFANLSGNAEYAKLAGALGSMKAAIGIVHSKAVIENVQNGNVTIEGTVIAVTNGYPSAASVFTAANIVSPEFNNIFIFNNILSAIVTNGCFIIYLPAGSNVTGNDADGNIIAATPFSPYISPAVSNSTDQSC